MPGINRYTSIDWSKPMSSYVGLPLDQLSRIGANMQKTYETDLEDTYKLNDLMASVNAIDQHKPYKKVLENKYYPKLEEITNRIVNQGDLTAQRDLNKLKRDWINDPLRQELEKSYGDYNTDVKAINELKQKGTYTDVYNPITGFQGSLDGTINPYRTKGARPVQDYLKTGSDLMKDIAKSGNAGKSYKIDNAGNVIGLESGWEAVYQQDVDRVANQSIVPFLKSNEGQFFIDEMKFNNPNATQEDVLGAANEYLKNLGNKQIFKKTESGRTFDYSPFARDMYKAGVEEKEKQNALIGQPLEGYTMDLTSDDKDFQDLKGSGIYHTNPDGTLNVDLKAIKRKPIYDVVDVNGRKVSTIVGYEDEKSQMNKLGKHLGKVADQIGYTGKITPENFNDIIRKYNEFSKVRSFDEQMASPISDIESQKAITNWNNYDMLDPNSPTKLLDKKLTIDKDDKLVLNTWRNSPDGKMNRGGYLIKYNDGKATEIPILVRPKGIIDDKFHNTISSLGLLGAKYEVGAVKGKSSPNSNIEELPNQRLTGIGVIEPFGYKSQDGKKVGYLVTPEDGSEAISFPTYADLQQYMNYKYYGTTVGSSETYGIAPKKQKFESTQE